MTAHTDSERGLVIRQIHRPLLDLPSGCDVSYDKVLFIECGMGDCGRFDVDIDLLVTAT